MKTTLKLAAAALMLGLPASASAALYMDADDIGGVDIQGGGTFSGTFNIVAPDGTPSFTVNGYGALPTANNGTTFTSIVGYTVGTPITSASVSFWFRNTNGDDLQAEVFTFDLSASQIMDSTNSGPFVLLATALNLQLIASLQANGLIDYTVTNLNAPAPGDSEAIIFDYALLTANTQNVPDGGTTIALLGGALTGLGLLRRKLRGKA